jgi:pyrrolidone-carboxylate peptidase
MSQIQLPQILATGFTPFDDREVNASWIAASHLGNRENVRALEIPVVWGKPAELLSPFFNQEFYEEFNQESHEEFNKESSKELDKDCPQIVISFGEGRNEWFDIETRARNQRDQRADNLGNNPAGPIDSQGADLLKATFDATRLQRMLGQQGWNIRVSGDAGQYLCEETLYTLETLKTRHLRLRSVLFIHMPPFGTTTYFKGERVRCDEKLINQFADNVITLIESFSLKAD